MAMPGGVKAVRIVGSSVALLVVIGTAVSVVESFFERIEVTSSPLADSRTAVVVDLDLGSVTVTTAPDGDPGRITRTAHWATRPPQSGVVDAGSTTTVSGHCLSALSLGSHCRVDVDVELPSGAAVRVSTSVGDIRLVALSGGVDVVTRVGDITGRNLSSSQVTARAGTGDVEVSFAAPPDQVEAVTTTGDVSLALPQVPVGDGYRITVHAPSWTDTSGVPSDPAASHHVTAGTTVGDVTISPGG